MQVGITGANGFVGSALFRELASGNAVQVTGSVRRLASSHAGLFRINTMDALTDWSRFLDGQQVIIHVAARAHVQKDDSVDPWTEYRKVNVEGTINLAHQAARAGVKRFIFISSIGVNGNITDRPFTENDPPCPAELYARSKWEAEQGLWQVQQQTGMEIVIIRPPLIYGPGAPGNFGSLVRWVRKGVPLPLGAVHNSRSFVALDNLIDLIITCIDHPAAANQVFLASDGEDLSTTALLRAVARAMGKNEQLVPVPAWILMLGAASLGKRPVARRLLGSLQVDISKARNLLGWEPPVSVKEGLKRCFVERD